MNVTCEKLIFNNELKERLEVIDYFVSEFQLDKQLLSENLEAVGKSDYREVEDFINNLRLRLVEVQQAFKLQTHQVS